jgi:hypothetical protein
MKNKRYKPKVDRLYYLIMIPTMVVVLTPVILCAISAPMTLFLTVPILLFTAYFFITTLFGYAELRESSLYIRYGFIMTKEIPYGKIRGIERERRIISPSILSIKNALDHVNIKYNAFDVTTLSVKKSDEFIDDLNERCGKKLA